MSVQWGGGCPHAVASLSLSRVEPRAGVDGAASRTLPSKFERCAAACDR